MTLAYTLNENGIKPSDLNFDTSIADGLAKVIYQQNIDESLSFFGNKFTVNDVSDIDYDDDNCFVVELFESGDDLNLLIIYNSAKYKKDSIELFARLYEKKLKELFDSF